MKKLILGAVLAALVTLPGAVSSREVSLSPTPAGITRSESAGKSLRSSLGRSIESRATWRPHGVLPVDSDRAAPDVTDEGEESGRALLHNCPNPFNPATTISYRLPEAASVDLAIYDVSGRLVRAFTGLRSEAGVTQQIVWDGTGAGGVSMPSGVYLLTMTTEKSTYVGKLVLLK